VWECPEANERNIENIILASITSICQAKAKMIREKMFINNPLFPGSNSLIADLKSFLFGPHKKRTCCIVPGPGNPTVFPCRSF